MSAFATTRWSIVQAAKGSSSNARTALETLCAQYRQPVRIYLERYFVHGMDTEDLVQEFFVSLLQSDLIGRANPNLGSFRAYMIAALRRFVSRQLEKQAAQKRGSPTDHCSLEDVTELSGSQLSPEQEFDQAWATRVLENALRKLDEEAKRSGRGEMFSLLSPFLTENAEHAEYDQIAAQLEMRSNTVAVAVHRLRARYQSLVRAEVLQTVSQKEQLEVEVQKLHSIISAQTLN
jgi:RNA polymerase sigma factor (sigma-70 family)